MEAGRRYAVYWLPEDGLAEKGAAWLGRDIRSGSACAHPDLPGLPAPVAELTERPRRYGFHATLKPPFTPVPGTGPALLVSALERLAARLAPAEADGLEVAALGPFLALQPVGETAEIDRVAAAVLRGLDAFRAGPGPEEIARRSAGGLTPAEAAHLQRWGYPHVLDRFRFHVTLTGPLEEPARTEVAAVLRDWLAPELPRPLRLSALALCVEDAGGCFRALASVPLSG